MASYLDEVNECTVGMAWVVVFLEEAVAFVSLGVQNNASVLSDSLLH